MKFDLAHSIGNRVRYRTKDTMSRETARVITEELSRIPDLKGIRVNPSTGSVLAFWESQEASGAFGLFAVAPKSSDCRSPFTRQEGPERENANEGRRPENRKILDSGSSKHRRSFRARFFGNARC